MKRTVEGVQRAYAAIAWKALEQGEERIIEGIATTPTPDRLGDVVEPKGAQFKLPIALLWQHRSAEPIGTVTDAKVTDKGITIRAKLARVTEAGSLKDRIDEAWQSVKYGLVRGLSIGFNPIEYSEIKGTYSLRFLEWEWLELSCVTIPANAEASISAIKSADRALQGTKRIDRPPAGNGPPDASGSQAARPSGGFFNARSKGNVMKTLEQLREERQQKADRLKELMELRTAENRRFADDEATEFDELTAEVAGLDDDIRVKQYEATQARSATPVRGKSVSEGSQSRAGLSFVRKTDPEDKFEGQSFVRCQIAKAIAMVHGISPIEIANERWGKSHPRLVEFIKATVAGGGTGSGEWGAELAQTDAQFAGDFIEYLYAKTVFDQLPLRSIPARVKVKGQDGAFTGYWVGESKGIPASAGSYSDVDLAPLKVAGLAVISMELLEDSQPSAEMLVRDGLVEASSQRVDQTFLSATAASAGVSPAGILNGLSALSPSGTDLAAVRADLTALVYPFVSNKMASGITLVMNPATGLALSMMFGSLDQRAFPDISQTGGTLNGLPVVVGDNVTPGDIIAIRSQDVWKIGDSGVRISMSKEATIEQRDDPSGATDTPTGVNTTGLTNMFQEESVAFKVVRRINFQKRRSAAVVYLSNTEYGGVVS